jgi:anti-sigma B factor antagonist
VIPNFQTRTIEPDIIVAELTGRLNLGNTMQSIESALHRLIEEGARKLVIDLAALTYIDSAGLGMLIGCNGRIEQAGGAMRIAGAKGVVLNSFGVAHLERILSFDDDVDCACRGF